MFSFCSESRLSYGQPLTYEYGNVIVECLNFLLVVGVVVLGTESLNTATNDTSMYPLATAGCSEISSAMQEEHVNDLKGTICLVVFLVTVQILCRSCSRKTHP